MPGHLTLNRRQFNNNKKKHFKNKITEILMIYTTCFSGYHMRRVYIRENLGILLNHQIFILYFLSTKKHRDLQYKNLNISLAYLPNLCHWGYSITKYSLDLWLLMNNKRNFKQIKAMESGVLRAKSNSRWLWLLRVPPNLQIWSSCRCVWFKP